MKIVLEEFSGDQADLERAIAEFHKAWSKREVSAVAQTITDQFFEIERLNKDNAYLTEKVKDLQAQNDRNAKYIRKKKQEYKHEIADLQFKLNQTGG